MAGLGDMTLAKVKADTEKIEADQATKKEPSLLDKIRTSTARLGDVADSLTSIGQKDAPPRPKMSSFIK